jgi:hypothetical protein
LAQTATDFGPATPPGAYMVEIFFNIVSRQAIRRGTFTSVGDLIAAIRAFIDGWNETLPAVHLDQGRRHYPGQCATMNTKDNALT